MQNVARDAKVSSLTQTDRQLLSILRQDARRSISEMAAMLGVSRTTVKERMDRLHETGVIEKFTIKLGELEPARHSGIQTFFAIRMHRPVCPILYGFVSGWPELVGCWSISGDLDMMMLIDCANNEEVERLRDKLARHPEVKTLTTTLVLKQWRLKSDLNGAEANEAAAI